MIEWQPEYVDGGDLVIRGRIHIGRDYDHSIEARRKLGEEGSRGSSPWDVRIYLGNVVVRRGRSKREDIKEEMKKIARDHLLEVHSKLLFFLMKGEDPHIDVCGPLTEEEEEGGYFWGGLAIREGLSIQILHDGSRKFCDRGEFIAVLFPWNWYHLDKQLLLALEEWGERDGIAIGEYRDSVSLSLRKVPRDILRKHHIRNILWVEEGGSPLSIETVHEEVNQVEEIPRDVIRGQR